MKRRIIVLTPVKNEEWILDAFLKTSLSYADHVILADQNSCDHTRGIAKSYSNVTLIENNSEVYDEAHRQKMLIKKARELFGSGNILMAIDSDEILTYDSLYSNEWNLINDAAPGTVLYFEKPTPYNGFEKVLRYETAGGWPLGFIDDGSDHQPTYIHSTRVPMIRSSPKLYLKEIKYLHLNLLSLSRQRSKVRYYNMLETLAGTKSWYKRIVYYNKKYNYIEQEGDGIADLNPFWITGWMEKGILFSKAKEEKFYWYDKESLNLFRKNKSCRFWMEDIWDINWNEARDYFSIKDFKVDPPPKILSLLRNGLYYLVVIFSSFMKGGKKLIAASRIQ